MMQGYESSVPTQNYSSLLNAQYSEPSAYSPYEHDEQTQLNQSLEQRYRDWPKSTYSDVSVLLLRWAADNLGVIEEVVKLRKLLRQRFNFSAEIWDIPSKDPEDELTAEILRFRKGKQKDSLTLLYYAGHGGGDPEQCIWTATDAEDSPSLNWHNIQGHLLGHECDTLFVLDCCQASLAASIHNTGHNWFLGASVKESYATGVSWMSFTSAMTRALERAANKYWTYRETYNVQSLSYDLNLWERDLPVTPNLLRLTSLHCDPTDLTPLLYPRARPKLASVRTEPISDNATDTRIPSLPQRPRKDHATLPSQSPASPASRYDAAVESRTHVIPIDISMTDACQTVRISRLPLGAVQEDIIGWLDIPRKPGSANVRLGPVIQNPSTKTSTAIATFPSVAVAKQALEIWEEGRRGHNGQHERPGVMDINFRGLTTVYLSAKGPNQEPNADIVLIHGAYGHPIKTFARHYISAHNDSTSTEICWPRDELPRILESGGIFPRVMVYGWHADAWLSPQEEISQAAVDLLSHLRDARRTASTRPLVFIGHGLGGVLIKEAVNSTIHADMERGHFETPISVCYFLATPHCGLDRGDDFSTIMAAMKTLQDRKSAFTRSDVQGLKARNPVLREISTGFDANQKEYGIRVLSATESLKTEDRYIVPEESAVYTGSSKDRIELGCNYRDLARLPATAINRDVALRTLADRITERLKPRNQHLPEASKAVKKREKVYGGLRKYDTVFLIDDSGSMWGRRWYIASKVLADVAAIAVKYDRNGVDLKFFNEPLEDEERKNIDTAEKVMGLFSRIEPDGPTLTANVIEEELNEYMYRYSLDRSIKGLNLIVLTDGEPKRGQKVEDVIVKYANELHAARAPLFQVGIQFVQIGAEKEAAEFLKMLDTKLKGKHGLDRDMVDTVHWVPGDEDRLYEKILLGGILKELDDEDESDGDEDADDAG